ncbi:MAG: sugar ABC transporter permease [Yoonia sp.]|nr:sugar ABC transporter permease [Yoonia sp.]
MTDATYDIAAAEGARRKTLPVGVFAWLLVAPAMIFILVIVAWPLAETIRLSFMEADLGGEHYVGTRNYQELLESRKLSPDNLSHVLLSTNGIKATGFQPVRFSVMYYNLPSHF